MLSIDLCQILRPKNAIFRSSKNANFVKNVATNPKFLQFHQKSIFSSRWPVFVISAVFHQKRNPLEPNYFLKRHIICY